MNYTPSPYEPCPHCGQYQNRAVTVDGIITRDNQILLIKRGAEVHTGMWALPGGYVDWNETIEDALAREMKEEVNINVTQIALVGFYDSIERSPKQTVNFGYHVAEWDGEPKAGDDAQKMQWFDIDDIPKLAFDHNLIIKDYLDGKRIEVSKAE